MPRKIEPLSALGVKRVSQQPGLHAVGGVAGLCLHVTPPSACRWILRTRIAGKRRHIGLGGFPTVTLEQARNAARGMLDSVRNTGADPIAEREAQRAELRASIARAVTFDQAAADYFRQKSQELRSDKSRVQWLQQLELYASPVIGQMLVADIELSHVLQVLQPHWTTKSPTMRKVRQRIEAVLDWAKVQGFRSGENPARWSGNLSHVLAKPSKAHNVEHHAAVPYAEMPAFMQELRAKNGLAMRALEFAILCASRTSEVLNAAWAEIDLDAKLWTIPAERMKGDKAHVVPLSETAVALLKSLPRQGAYVFSQDGTKPLADSALYNALKKRLKSSATPHGFRSSFKDWSRSEATEFSDECSELCLAHVNSDSTRAAYARDGLIELRRQLLAKWSDYLRCRKAELAAVA